MTIELTAEGLRAIFPRAPADIIADVAAWQQALDRVGVTTTRTRLAYFFANIEHECGGFTIPNLTESLAYTAERMAAVWPNRFKSEAAVRAKYGTADGWQKQAFDDIYGSRMGNRPGSHDGSLFIGRGGPQWTGRDGYAALERLTGLPVVLNPQMAAGHVAQPSVCAAFWDWKKLNALADVGDFTGVVKRWNGGTNGIADRLARMKGNDPVIARLDEVTRIMPTAKQLPGAPPTPQPPAEVIRDATARERSVGVGSVVSGGAAATAGTLKQPDAPVAFLPPFVTWTLIGLGAVIVIVAVVLIARKKAAIAANWF